MYRSRYRDSERAHVHASAVPTAPPSRGRPRTSPPPPTAPGLPERADQRGDEPAGLPRPGTSSPAFIALERHRAAVGCDDQRPLARAHATADISWNIVLDLPQREEPLADQLASRIAHGVPQRSDPRSSSTMRSAHASMPVDEVARSRRPGSAGGCRRRPRRRRVCPSTSPRRRRGRTPRGRLLDHDVGRSLDRVDLGVPDAVEVGEQVDVGVAAACSSSAPGSACPRDRRARSTRPSRAEPRGRPRGSGATRRSRRAGPSTGRTARPA